jgi:hypothetical protein
MGPIEFSDQFDIELELLETVLKNNFGLLALLAGRATGASAQALESTLEEVSGTLHRLHELKQEEVKPLLEQEKRRNDELRQTIFGQ